MIKKNLSKDWLFAKDWKYHGGNGEYQRIDLPHDYAVSGKRHQDIFGGQGNGFYPDEKGIYKKFLTFEKDKHYILDIDGAYMCTQVFLNENHLAMHPYGYTPMLVDLTENVIEGIPNKLIITTTPLPGSSRWYSGNGLYRDVFLWEGGDVRIEPWDLFIYTLEIAENAAHIGVKYTVTADRLADVTVCFRVLSPAGEPVKKVEVDLKAEASAVPSGGMEAEGQPDVVKTEQELEIAISAPELWDTEHPALYTLETEIYENGELLDASVNTFGIRTISADAKRGLLLNGRPIKLRGGCIHHDHGVLGAAAFPAAEARKIRLLKEAGFNAVRTAHNPPSLALLETCDAQGMILMDEAFDVWNKGKRYSDYHLFFEDWCLRDISYMVLRDRNHPCVFSYSIGNEILEVDGTSQMAEWAEKLAAQVRKYDTTRFVTSGMQKAFSVTRLDDSDPEEYKQYFHGKYQDQDHRGTTLTINETTAGYEVPLDIVGCNYYYKEYLLEQECYPERVIWGSETQAVHFYDSWKLTKENAFIIGDFTWTAYDNMGEVGAGRGIWARDGYLKDLSLGGYPWRCCYQGDLDLCGFRRPQSYFREAVWLGGKEPRIFVTHPEHFGEDYTGTEWHWYDVNETWTFADHYVGCPVRVETYTDADSILWYVNDRKLGESIPVKGIAALNTVYDPGTITAIACKDGKECGKYSLHTTGEAAAIHVEAEQEYFRADNRDLCYFDITITDRAGNIVTDAGHELKCHVQGGELLGIFSGDPCNEDQYTSDTCHAFKGRALAIVRTAQPGEVGLKVYAKELASGYGKVIGEKSFYGMEVKYLI